MTCSNGDESCETPRRHAALWILALMALIFLVLSLLSFTQSRGQVTPAMVDYGPYKATDGKRVFQAYNCMDCHTMVGNGGYLGPDLTREYAKTGAAWLAAFLPSAGGWPTDTAVRIQLRNALAQDDAGTAAIDEYYKKFPGAASRVERRGGGTTQMPNLPLTRTEVGQLIAYMKYTSSMDTEGWPPKVKIRASLQQRVQMAGGAVVAAIPAPVPTGQAAEAAAADAGDDPATRGAQLVKQYGCTACHASSRQRRVGPGWGGLAGSSVKLADGKTVVADDAYLAEAILRPASQVADGYQKGVMPSYDGMLEQRDVEAIVAYLHTLGDTP